MRHPVIEGLRRRVPGHPQDLPASDPGRPPGAMDMDEEEAERPPAPQQIGVGPLAGARLARGQGLELDAPRQVVGEDAQLLPGAVGAVVGFEPVFAPCPGKEL